MTSFFLKEKAWLWPMIALALITPFTPYLDLTLTNSFYAPTHHFESNAFYNFLYNYGTLPAQILFGISAILLFLASFFKKWKKWHSPALILVLTLIIGSGLIVHEMLKEHWGRPRPKQVVEFGGQQVFRPYYQPNFFHQPEPSKSFSCGHCTMGFYFFALALVAKRLNHHKTFWGALIFTFALGTALSIARIAQGGHFLSDTIASALIMWLTAYMCDRLVYQKAEEK